MTHDHHRPDYRPPEPPTGWHDQDWLLILTALDHYAREGNVSAGQELRACQLIESSPDSLGPSHSVRSNISTGNT